MRYRDSIFVELLKPISRRQFRAIVERHDGDAYEKSFDSWNHLVTLIFAQFGGVDSLRGLTAGWNAQAHHHYHLGAGRLARSTVRIFAVASSLTRRSWSVRFTRSLRPRAWGE